jgi:hypothetical protein
MHDLRNTRRCQHLRKRGEVRNGERINARGVAMRRQLQQAQLGTIRSLSQELGIEAYVLARLEVRGEINEGGRCRDYVLQRVRRLPDPLEADPSEAAIAGPFGADVLAVQSGDAHYASQTPVYKAMKEPKWGS